MARHKLYPASSRDHAPTNRMIFTANVQDLDQEACQTLMPWSVVRSHKWVILPKPDSAIDPGWASIKVSLGQESVLVEVLTAMLFKWLTGSDAQAVFEHGLSQVDSLVQESDDRPDRGANMHCDLNPPGHWHACETCQRCLPCELLPATPFKVYCAACQSHPSLLRKARASLGSEFPSRPIRR